jgi:pimeloyl-ACP methyl ester carboxylesterase
MKAFLTELKRRHVYRFGLIYLAVAWLLLQVTVTVQEPLNLPEWSDTLVIILLALGFPLVLVLAWALETKPADVSASAGSVTVESGVSLRDPAGIAKRGDIRFCVTQGGYRLAYSRFGSGMPLLRTGNWLSHQELEWDDFIWGPYLRDLSREFEMITYDGRGTGLSDREVDEFSLETMVEDMEVVVDANRLDKFAILAFSQSCAVSIAYAVRHPERVSRMVFFGGFTHNFRTEEEVRAMATLFAQNWGQDNAATRQIFTSALFPDATKEEFDSFNDFQRRSISPRDAARLFEACHAIDVREEAKKVSCPTLVMHARDEVGVSADYGRLMASLIPDARFVSLNSRNHVVLGREPAYQMVIEEMVAFMKEAPQRTYAATP